MAGAEGQVGCGTVVREPDPLEVPTLVMSLPSIDGVHSLAPPSSQPIARMPAVRVADGEPLRLVLVTADLEPAQLRRIRVECAELEAKLSDADPARVLPMVDHGVDAAGRPYLLFPRPGPDLSEILATEGPLPVATVIAAARATATGLDALAALGIVGPPPAVCHRSGRADGGLTLGTPLPPVLVELAAALGEDTGDEPPEVLGGADWTPGAQVYAGAAGLWTLLSGAAPFPSRLARLVGSEPDPMRRPDVPAAVVEVLRGALRTDPALRPPTPGALAAALEQAATARPDVAALAQTVGGGALAHHRPLGSQYLLEAPIGEGAGGRVWAARRRSDGGPVAVKLLRAELAEDEQALARFMREFQVLQRLSHPHLVRVHDFVIDAGQLGIVMDLVDGEDLRRVARRGQLTIIDAATLLAQTADALAAVHAARVVHRDVKPANILVTERDGRPAAVLSDFGIARAILGSAQTEMIGTPSYLAPELIAGRAPGPPADVYALGVTAYELLAGRKPFEGTSVDAIARAHLEEPPIRPEGLPDGAWELLSACLDKAPERRPDAAAVSEGWSGLATGGGLARRVTLPAPPAGPLSIVDEGTALASHPLPEAPAPAGRPGGRRRLVVAVVVVAVLGLGLGVLLAAWRARSAPPPKLYQVPATISLDASGAGTISWSAQAGQLPGLRGFVVYDGNGDALNSEPLGRDAVSFPVSDLRPGRRSCYLVIALGVTAAPLNPGPPLACVTPPTPRP